MAAGLTTLVASRYTGTLLVGRRLRTSYELPARPPPALPQDPTHRSRKPVSSAKEDAQQRLITRGPHCLLAMAPVPPALPPNWQKVDDAGGNSYYWNTVTQAVSWTPPEWPAPGGTAPPGTRRQSRRGPPGAVGSDSRTQAMNDPVYMGIVNKNAPNMRTLQRGLSNLDIAVRMPPTTAVPPTPYTNPKGLTNLPPPPGGGYSAPPPGGGYSAPPPGGGYSAPPLGAGPPPPGAGLRPTGAGGRQPPPGGGAPRGGPPRGDPPPSGEGSGSGGEKKADPTAMQHRLRAIPYYARNVSLITSTVVVWLGMITLFTPEYLSGVEDASPETQHGHSALPLARSSQCGHPQL